MTELQGQDAALGRLRRMKASGKVPSALIFAGPEGSGTLEAARWFGELLNGGPNLAVVEVNAAYQAALREEESEKQHSIRVDTVRELTRRASRRADAGVWKVFILDKAETLETQAANALLKELEEPEADTVWILVTPRPGKLLSTIRSRCQTVTFRAASRAAVDPAFVELADSGRTDPGAYWAVSQGLGRDLGKARETAAGVIDALIERQNRESRIENRTATVRKQQNLLKLKGSLTSNVSPQLVVQLAFLESE